MIIIKNLIIITLLSLSPNLISQETGKAPNESKEVAEQSIEQQKLSEKEKLEKQKSLKYILIAFFLLAAYSIHLFIKARKRKAARKAIRESRQL